MMSLYQQRGVRVKRGIEIPNSQVWSLYHLLSSLSKPASRGGLPDGNNPDQTAARWHQGKRELANLSWEKEKYVQIFSTGQCLFGGCQLGRLYPVTLGLLSSFYLLYHCAYVYTCVCTHTHGLMEDVKCIGFLKAEDLLRISFMLL